MAALQAQVRALIARFPWLAGARFALQRQLIAAARHPAEPDYRALAHFRAGEGECVLDVGANRGLTLVSTRLYLPGVALHAFEPNPVLAADLQRLFRADEQLTIHAVGLGAAPGAFNLFVPFYRGYMFDGLASFDRAEAADWLNAERLARFDARHLEVREFACRVETMDSFGLAPAFVKVDVQGHEAKVIEGGAATLQKHEPAVLMEYNTPERDAAWLLANGWRPYHWREGRLHRAEGYALNILYITERRRRDFDPAIFAPNA
jgi:FkbM family methyltransferase